MKRPSLILPLSLMLLSVSVRADAQVALPDAAYLGGNIRVLATDNTTVHVEPDLRDTQQGQWWFYWNLRITSPAPSSTQFTFKQNNPIGVRGPAASYDGGQTWQWLGADAVKESALAKTKSWSFTARVPDGKPEARFGFCPTYQQSHLEAWLAKHRKYAALKVDELCKSRKGRSVELLRAGCLDRAKQKGIILLTSRHHCCETMATYTLESILEAALINDALGQTFRNNWEIIAVPFMDKDGCEDGDQGKNRAPHDHNRDYNETPLYPEVAAMMKLGAAISNRVLAAIDLHCPWIRGEWNDRVYIVGSEDAKRAAQQRAFAKLWEKTQTGPIKFRERDILAYGQSWNTSNNFTAGRSFKSWAADSFPEARLASTIEIPYADALGTEVNATTARALGRDLAATLAALLTGPLPLGSHPLLGRWTAPLDGKPGFVREFRPDGGVTVWWPDGKIAATGTFFAVSDTVLGADYPDGSHDFIRQLAPDRIQIDRVQPPGEFRKYQADRIR